MAVTVDINKLQRCWLQQLQLEFAEICQSYTLDLSLPIFEISDSKKEFGAWHAATRTIRLSRHLILQYSWSVTLQVLKHEMAHQLCSEIWQSGATPHGPDFQQACALLGVLPEYRRAGSALAQMVEQAGGGLKISTRGQECLARVQKLLALSQSSNEHEATLAMQKANELIEKYHIEELGSNAPYRYGFGIIDRKKKRIESYQRRICTILHDFFFVRVVLTSLYDPLHDQTYKTIELLGTKENVAIAEYCYFFLENRLASLWSLHKGRFKGSVRTEKNSYYLGLLRGFYQKLQDQKKTTSDLRSEAHVGALVVADEKRLADFVALRFPRLIKAARSGARIYQSTYEEGVATGKTISFAEGLTADKKTFGGLLS